jgi:hypothetical protein
VGSEHTTPEFELENAVYALHGEAIVIGEKKELPFGNKNYDTSF